MSTTNSPFQTPYSNFRIVGDNLITADTADGDKLEVWFDMDQHGMCTTSLTKAELERLVEQVWPHDGPYKSCLSISLDHYAKKGNQFSKVCFSVTVATNTDGTATTFHFFNSNGFSAVGEFIIQVPKHVLETAILLLNGWTLGPIVTKTDDFVERRLMQQVVDGVVETCYVKVNNDHDLPEVPTDQLINLMTQVGEQLYAAEMEVSGINDLLSWVAENPQGYAIQRAKIVNGHLLVEVYYYNHANYNGNILLAFGKNVTPKDLVSQGWISPTVGVSPSRICPIAQFLPTFEGWALAEAAFSQRGE